VVVVVVVGLALTDMLVVVVVVGVRVQTNSVIVIMGYHWVNLHLRRKMEHLLMEAEDPCRMHLVWWTIV
jgi:hypothetical protein